MNDDLPSHLPSPEKKTIWRTLVRPFWNRSERRIRAVWRLLLQLLLTGLILGLLQWALAPWAFGLPAPWNEAVFGGSAVLAFVLSIGLSARWLDRRSWADLGFHFSAAWWGQLAFGLFLGAFLMTLIFITEWAVGWVEIQETWYVVDRQTPFWLAYLQPIILFLAVGFYEELFSRGYQLRNMAEGLNGRWLSPKAALLLGTLLSSAVFGALHAANPNATAISTFNIAVAGVLLAAGFLLTGELAIPIGLHITWNFFQGNVFGWAVSGTQTTGASILRISQSGPELITGGAFGPEAGLIGLAAMAVGLGLTWWFVRWQTGRAALQTDLATYSSIS